MINLTLFKKELKSNYILMVIFIGVLTMYAAMIVMMFDPKLGDSLKAMAESMPDIFAAFGMLDVGTTLLEFVIGYLYGMLFVAFPGVFIIILANRLCVKYVDNGSMAYLLAVPHKRRNIITTQAVFLLASLLVLVAYVTGLILLVSHAMYPGELDVSGFLAVNIGLFGLLILFGGVCFFASCLCNDSKISTGISAGIVIYSVLVQMISQVGDKFENLKYATPLTLFNAKELAAGNADAWVTCGILYIVGIAFLAAGGIGFCKRNLPI